MKKLFTALMLCLVSIVGLSQTITFHTGNGFNPDPSLRSIRALSYLNWNSDASLSIAEIFMINDSTARVVLNQAKESTTFYFQVGDNVYYYYSSGYIYHYAIYKDNNTIYDIRTYKISAIKNNELTMELVSE